MIARLTLEVVTARVVAVQVDAVVQIVRRDLKPARRAKALRLGEKPCR